MTVLLAMAAIAAPHAQVAHYTPPPCPKTCRQQRAWRRARRLGTYHATSYGPPWAGINGTGVTATGINLRSSPPIRGIAVDPQVIPLGTRVRIRPNPFKHRGCFRAFDTGGAIQGHRIDFYDPRGRAAQYAWGGRTVRVRSCRRTKGKT